MSYSFMHYPTHLLALSTHLPRVGRLAQPTHMASCVSRLCGATTHVELEVREGKIVDFAHETKACAFGLACMSLLAQHVIGAQLEEIAQLVQELRKMLHEDGPSPKGRWAPFALLESAGPYPTRHPAILLMVECIDKALNNRPLA